MCAHVCEHTHAHVWRGGLGFGGLGLCGAFQRDSGLIYFLFSFIAINWLLIGWNVQLSISSNTIK